MEDKWQIHFRVVHKSPRQPIGIVIQKNSEWKFVPRDHQKEYDYTNGHITAGDMLRTDKTTNVDILKDYELSYLIKQKPKSWEDFQHELKLLKG